MIDSLSPAPGRRQIAWALLRPVLVLVLVCAGLALAAHAVVAGVYLPRAGVPGTFMVTECALPDTSPVPLCTGEFTPTGDTEPFTGFTDDDRAHAHAEAGTDSDALGAIPGRADRDSGHVRVTFMGPGRLLAELAAATVALAGAAALGPARHRLNRTRHRGRTAPSGHPGGTPGKDQVTATAPVLDYRRTYTPAR